MTSQPPPISEVLADPAVADMIAESGPWWLWTADAAHLVATNAAGARAMGATGTAAATARSYDQSHAFAGQIRRMAGQPGEAVRSERLRIFGRFGSESAVAEVRSVAAGETRLIAVRLAAPRRGDARETARAFLGDMTQPALLFARDGAPLGASGAAAGIGGLPLAELIAPEITRVTADLDREGRASVALVNGTMVLARVAAADAIIALLPQADLPVSTGGLRLVASAPAVAEPATEPAAEPAAVAEPAEAGSAEDPAEPDPITLAEPEAADAPEAGTPATQDAPAAPEAGTPAAPELPATSETAPIAAELPSTADAGEIEAPVRFAWRMDGSLTFHAIEPATMAAPAGLTLHEASARFGLDPESQFARAVEASRPFSGVPAVWPLGDGPRRLAVTLAAFPTLREGGLQGYAGFGLVVEEIAPAQAPVEIAEPEQHAPAEDARPEDAADEATAQETATDAPLAEATADDAPHAAADAPASADAEVNAALPATGKDAAADARPVLTLHTNPPNVVALRSSAGQDPRRQGLSPGERNAFREIARALGARTEFDEETPAATRDAPPETAPEASQTGQPDEAATTAASEAAETQAPPADTPEVAEKTPVASTPVTDELDTADAASGDEPVEALPEADIAPTAPDVAPPPMEQQRSIIPPAFAATPPIAPLEPPAIRDFVDSGTPFGPLPSAFGATPPADDPAPAEPQAASAPAADPNADMRALLDRVPAGLVVHRGNQVLFANRTVLDWIGFADAPALEQAGGIARLFASDRAQGEGNDSVTLTARDGSTIAVDARLTKTTWSGEPAFLFTLRRPEASADAESEAADLAELRGRLDEVEQILDTATDGIVIVNADASIESMNRSAEALFGYESAEVKGRSVTALFAPESHRSALDYCDGLLSNGVASILNDGRQIIGRVKQGGLIPLYMTMGRTGPAGKPKLAAVFRDMTQWKKAEEDLVAAKRQAEQASSQKSDFLAKISHEIRTPLNAIIGFSEVMMEERFGPVGNERYRDYLKDIHSSGGHVLSLINDLLDLSKIEAGKLELSFTSVDLNDIIQSTVAIMQPQANRERVIIRSSLQPRLPNVVADSRSLRQIVLNLLSNSVKFTPAGGQIIVSTALSDAGEAVLRVRDTGVGMTETELRAAMEPFRQVATSNPRAAKGTGLGLPLTKALVEANRASFGISSTPNQGTLVEVVFPPTRVLAE
ncbi:MAG: PAS domain S-box protein [Proteobacteria bacterium]|nr:PAS domain S-box protein [Pseudomonadota bacterium]